MGLNVCCLIFKTPVPFVISVQVLKEDDTLWPQPDRVGRQVSEYLMIHDHCL